MLTTAYTGLPRSLASALFPSINICYLISSEECSLTNAPVVFLGPKETMHEDYCPGSIGGGVGRFMEIVGERYLGTCGIWSSTRYLSQSW